MTSSFDIHTQEYDYIDQPSEKNSRDLVIVIGAVAVVILSLLLVTLMFFGRRNHTTTTAVQHITTPAARMARTDLLITHMNDNFSLPNNNISLTAKKIKNNTPVIVPAHLEHFITLMDVGADLYCADLINQQRFAKAFDDIITATCRNDQVAEYATKTVALPHLCQSYLGNVGIGRFGSTTSCTAQTITLPQQP